MPGFARKQQKPQQVKRTAVLQQDMAAPLPSRTLLDWTPELSPRVSEGPISPGRPLDDETREFFEPRLGHDFSRVRVHNDAKGAESARAINAAAYTVGADIVFGEGRYAPHASEGRRILAHELAHVVQQTGSQTPSPAGQAVRVVQRTSRPAIMRAELFTSTMEICLRLLKSRVFHVSQGGIIVTADATWDASSEWQGEEAPQCGREYYNMTLMQEGTIWDSCYGDCRFEMGTPVRRAWGDLPEGDYYLTIWTNNTNPMCCLRGDITVWEERGITGQTCTQPPPGPLEILHTALDLVGLIPALGAVPDSINAGIYLIEGDWVNAGISAVAIVPIFGEAAAGVRIGRRTATWVTGEAVQRVGPDRIADGLREARTTRRAAREAAEEAPGTRGRRPEGPEPHGTRARVPGLPGCRPGSLHCPISYLQEEFPRLFDVRRTSEFAPYIRRTHEIDLNMGQSLRREQTILTGDEMYAQFLREVPESQWSRPFREAMAQARRRGEDYREFVVQGRRHRWPLDDIGDPWVVHHDPPLLWVAAESNALWHPMPYRMHDSAHGWWRRLERQVRERIPPDVRREILEGDIDIRDL